MLTLNKGTMQDDALAATVARIDAGAKRAIAAARALPAALNLHRDAA